MVKFHGLTEYELDVVDHPKRAWIERLFWHFFHEVDAELEVREHDRAIFLDSRNGSNSDNGFTYDTEIALVSNDQLLEVWTSRDSWQLFSVFESTLWSDEGNSLNNVFDCPLSELFHPRSSGWNPATECWELAAVGLTAGNDSKSFEVSLQILYLNASLNLGDHIDCVDPQNLIHSAHVKTYDHSCVGILLKLESLSHVCSTSVWDNDNVMLVCKLDDFLHMVWCARVHNYVAIPFEAAVLLQSKNLSQTCSMWMFDSLQPFEWSSTEAL